MAEIIWTKKGKKAKSWMKFNLLKIKELYSQN